MELTLLPRADKKKVFENVLSFLQHHDFKIVDSDQTRPWGGFYVLEESQAPRFIELFFPDVAEARQQTLGKISPKILIVEEGKRLSWQYHYRRAEIWKVIYGEAGVITSNNDEEGDLHIKKKGDVIILKQGERHRLIGTKGWGIIAEIWQHTDSLLPSDEEDIVRLQDDFGR